ncbi:MAG: hypothetical protein WCR54_07960, partial [Clostridia bacterium]
IVGISGKVSTTVLPKDSPKSQKKMVKLSALSMPLRSLFNMTNGLVSQRTIDGLIKRINGYPFMGLGMMIGGCIKKDAKKDINPNYKFD